MKRIILTGVALLAFVATIQAQNTATVSQNGNGQTNTVLQTGANNQTIIRQLTGTATSPNTGNNAQVTQQATATLPTTNQAVIDQINGADYNRAIIGQTMGSGNKATIEQKGGNGFRSGGTALLSGASPDNSGTGRGNDAGITQTGSGNDQTFIKQNAGPLGGSGANAARITQIGNANLGTVIEQSNKSSENMATVNQGTVSGGASGNSVVVLQNDDSQRNKALVGQEGLSKSADVRQITLSRDNQATTSQTGTDGNATIYQTDDSQHNQASVDQVATGNVATVFQTAVSAYNQATIQQVGSGSNALIVQSEQAKNNAASIRQGAGGMANSAVITQTYAHDGAGSSLVYSSGSTASIQQNLTSNSSIGNQAEVTQGFAAGISTVTGSRVISDDNSAVISQENDVNVTRLLQGGVGNQATVNQRGYSTLKGVDSGLVINDVAEQLGNLNRLQVNQSGTLASPNVANVRQVGIGNSGTIGQTAN